MQLALEPILAIDYAEPRSAMFASLPTDRFILRTLRAALLTLVLAPCLTAAAALSAVLLFDLP
ncbi:MAG: hypothetical protein HUU22_17720 [Phycisphaerae bacterium]|nr:hypothetical protein [Phycisphaerae bacterium]NUQ47861.1 hypothetical protein [Phycisphaerae bacterium]